MAKSLTSRRGAAPLRSSCTVCCSTATSGATRSTRSRIQRCIALDLMGHGATKTPADADMSFDAQVAMIGAFLDALKIDQVDLVANDSGGGIARSSRRRTRTASAASSSPTATRTTTTRRRSRPADGAAKAGQLAAIGKTGWRPEALQRSFGVASARADGKGSDLPRPAVRERGVDAQARALPRERGITV